jgi:hypothetical protein
MADRIYVTYTPTGAPGCFHTAIHYERTGPAGHVVQHTVIQAEPEYGKVMGSGDKAMGVIEEAFRDDDAPSRFGRIKLIESKVPSDDPNAPYEIIAEGDDLSHHLARMQLFAHGFDRAGFAYRGDHQNSNSFASAALRAAELPPAAGVAHDPVGPPGELLVFFAPGLNEQLRAPIGPRSSDDSDAVNRAQAGEQPKANDAQNIRVLGRRVIAGGVGENQAGNGSVSRDGVDAMNLTQRPSSQGSRPFGIFSGKPMSLTPLPPSALGLTSSDSSDNGNWFTGLARTPAQIQTSQAPSLDDLLRGIDRDGTLRSWFAQR